MNFKLSQQKPFALFAVLSALILLTIWIIFNQWSSDWLLAHKEMVPLKTLSPKQNQARLIATIPAMHLFGKTFTKAQVPITSLQLLVTGIVKGYKLDSASKAYISTHGQTGKIYRVGDFLSQGVKVYAITSDSVILENDGRLEKLLLPRHHLQFRPVPKKEHL